MTNSSIKIGTMRSERIHSVRSNEHRCSVTRHATVDIDDQAASLTGWSQHYDQLSPGRYQGALTECWIDDLQLVREQSNQSMHQMGSAWNGSRTFIIPMQQCGTARFGMQLVDAACPLTLSPGGELDFRTPQNMDVMSIVVCADTISNYSSVTEGFELESMLKGCGSISDKSTGLMELRELLLSISKLIDDETSLLHYPSVRNGLRQAILGTIINTFSSAKLYTSSHRTFAHSQIVKKAKEYVLENTVEPVTIAELCGSIGVSRRTLQMCFQEVMGTNPVQYLRAVRLNCVRRDLKANDAGKLRVQDVACHWGFWHLSSFTVDYKRMFGELPSQTLTRST